MKKIIDLQLFADDAAGTAAESAASGTDTAEKINTAAADQKDAKDKKATSSDEKKYSDADLDEIINKKFARWQKDQQKAVDEAQKLAAMNATQKAEYERDKLQKELDEYKHKDALAEMSKTARKMLTDEGISVSDELLSLLVTTDAEKTKAAVDGFKKAFKDAVDEAVKERVKGKAPTTGTGGGTTSMTKEAIMAIKDPELRQQKMLENKHLFNF